MFRSASIAAVVLCTAASLLPGCASTEAAPRSDDPRLASLDPVPAGDVLLHVRGMSCPQCITNVDLQLLALRGVQRAHVDMGAGTVLVTVGGSDRPAPADFARAVERAGFTLAGLEVLP